MFKIILSSLFLMSMFSIAKPATCEQHVKIILGQLSAEEKTGANVYVDCAVKPAKSVLTFTTKQGQMSPFEFQSDSYLAFIDRMPAATKWPHLSGWIVTAVMDDKMVGWTNFWESITMRFIGDAPSEFLKCPATLKLIHSADKSVPTFCNLTVWP